MSDEQKQTPPFTLLDEYKSIDFRLTLDHLVHDVALEKMVANAVQAERARADRLAAALEDADKVLAALSPEEVGIRAVIRAALADSPKEE